jgi:hypothetical protein
MKTGQMFKRRGLNQIIMALAGAMNLIISVHAVESSNSNFRLRAEINTGGDESIANAQYNMLGSFNAMETVPMDGNVKFDPGLSHVLFFPNAIADLTIQPTGPNSAHLEWTHPNTGVSYTEPVVSYELRFSQAEITEQNFLFIPNPLAITRSGDPKQIYDLTLLSYDTNYHVGVVSIDNAGNKSFLHDPKEFWTLPNDPSDLNLVADHENKAVILTFNPNNPNTGHSLKFEAALFKQGQMPPALPESEVIMENVQDNAPQTIVFDRDDKVKRQQAYAVFLRAYNGNNEHSNWVQAPGTVEIDKKLPTLKPVGMLTASGFIVYWERNLLFGTYQAYVDSDLNFNSPIIKPIPRQNLSSQDYLGLKGNTRYYYKVKAWDIWGRELGETTAESVVTHVLPPTNVFGTTISDTEAAVSWKKNVNNSSASHDYRVFVSTDASFPATISKFKELRFSGAEEMATTFDNLIPNGGYYVKIVGISQVGEESQGSDIYVSASPVFNTNPEKPFNIVLTRDAGDPSTKMTLTWNPNNNPKTTRYEVLIDSDNKFNNPIRFSDVPAQLQGEETSKDYTMTGLTPNLAYYAKVEAHGHNGTVVVSDVSNEAETAPADVESIALEPVGDQTRELKLTWDKKGNSARTKYAVELTTNATGAWTSYPLVTDVSEYAFTGLISNQQYIARVKVEGGNYSREQSAYTWPSAVVNLSSSAVANGTHEVKFEWAPGNNAEATIYEVLLSTENGGNRSEFPVRETVRGARSIVFGALEGVVWANEKYDVKVRVKPDNGNLTAPDKTASAWTEPLAVGSLVFPVVSSHSVQAQWGEPVSMVNSVAVVNAPGTGYTLEWSTREGELQSWKSLAGGQGGYSEWLEPGPPLTPDTTYYVIVRTKRRDNGVSTTFTPQAVVTNVSKPILGRLDISPSTRSSVVRWDRKSNPLDTMYEVAVYDGNKQMPPVIVRATHTIVGGLTPAKAYEFTVTAVGRGITPSRESSETVQKTTLPEPPLVEKIIKPVVAGDKQQLEVEWSKGANELINEYVARIYLVGSGTLPNYESSVSPAVFSGLDPNREYVVQIRSQNAVGDYSVGATTQTYTLPAVPGAPQATTILSNFQLGISFENQTQNPATTEYAVRLVAKAGFSGTPDASAGKYALLPGAGGTTTFSSDDPVWGRRSEWLGGSKLILTRLPDTFGYEVVLSARNDLKEEVGPGVGMAIAQSAGVPTVKMTLPTGEDLTQLDSLNKAIYYNGMTVPFTAVGSSHFNVLWSSRTRTIENNDMDQTYGWNGLLDVREDVVQADEDKFSKNDKAVGGFAVREEGEYFLNIAGTAMVDTGSGNLDVHDVFESTSPFRVYIDTTPPVAGALEVYFSSEAARDRNQEQRISTGTMWGDPNPYVTWDPTDLLGKEVSRSPVEGWTVRWSTDSAVLPSVDRAELTKEVGFEMDLTGVKESKTYYIKVRGYDRAGNWTADRNVPVFIYQYTPDQIAPRWSSNHIVMTGIRYPAIDKTIRFAAVAAANNFVNIGFEEEMLIPGDSIQLMLYRDSAGTKVDKPAALKLPTTSYVTVTSDSKSMVVLPFNATDLKPAMPVSVLQLDETGADRSGEQSIADAAGHSVLHGHGPGAKRGVCERRRERDGFGAGGGVGQ